MSTPVDTAALRALEASATPGEWSQEPGDNGFTPLIIGGERVVAETFDRRRKFNAALIVETRNSLIPMLDELDALREQAKSVEAVMATLSRRITRWVDESHLVETSKRLEALAETTKEKP